MFEPPESLSDDAQQDLISRAAMNTHGHEWEFAGHRDDCCHPNGEWEWSNSEQADLRERRTWVWLRCRQCKTRIAAHRFIGKAHTGWTMKWQDNGGQFHGVWLTPSCEEVMLDCLKPVMES
jgi:hypothetical protein